MNRNVLLLSVIGTGLMVSLAPAAEPARGGFREQYGALVEHNMFLRDRYRAPRTEPTSRPASAPRSAEQTYVLSGVVVESGGARAYLEDRSSGKLLKVAEGDAIAHGKISRIEIDAIAYEHDGNETWINVGADLTGTTAAEPVAVTPTTGPATGDTGAPAGNLSAIERMKLRRQQESKKP